MVKGNCVTQNGEAVGHELVVISGVKIIFDRLVTSAKGSREVVGKDFGYDYVPAVLIDLNGPGDSADEVNS